MIVLKATQDRVLSVLQSVAGIVERRHTLPILANVLLRKTRHGIADHLPAISKSRFAQPLSLAATPAASPRPWGTQTDRHPAHHACGPNGTLESSQNKIIVKGGKSKFTLQTMAAEDFPWCRSRPTSVLRSACPKNAQRFAEPGVFAMAVHDIRYYLNGILFVAEGKQLSLVATDGHRLAFASATLDVEVPSRK